MKESKKVQRTKVVMRRPTEQTEETHTDQHTVSSLVHISSISQCIPLIQLTALVHVVLCEWSSRHKSLLGSL